MKLEPGLYKIADNSPISKCYYLHVYYEGKRKHFQLNHYHPEKADDFGVLPLEGFRFVKRLKHPLDVRKVRITIEWQDGDDDTFQVSMTNVQMIRILFEKFPEIARAAGANLKPGKRAN
ncbi:hypothetical protein GCM10009122_23080 [Fulvivirga kasyanovii]|uniref:Transposase n=1 Tax=Fulvivirga kasyanovii TaxID=396812 RepID=A0ABW9S0K8_9BACT|nr:hypothetical protein [Fulvivirga kasyanovii]MTI28985.1 hypothetical protein [Fulvivirga kasyanovii]